MRRYVAFLRAINVGGRTVKMDVLRGLFEELQLSRVETFIASGNVVFTTRARSEAALERRIEAHLKEALGYEVATFLRRDTEVATIAECPPFSATELDAAQAQNVGFLAAPMSAAAKRKLQDLESEVDVLRVDGREIYWLCRVKQSESTFSNTRCERALDVRATFRGLNTVRRLAAKYPPGSACSRQSSRA